LSWTEREVSRYRVFMKTWKVLRPLAKAPNQHIALDCPVCGREAMLGVRGVVTCANGWHRGKRDAGLWVRARNGQIEAPELIQCRYCRSYFESDNSTESTPVDHDADTGQQSA